ncbi:MAG TPA: DUF3786 domain-containing protein [Anaerolineae bacterium]|nr:DUF3786 domain-containing protein [Anaerolineae bacterium]
MRQTSIRARAPEETYGPALTLAKQQLAQADPARIAHLASVPYTHAEATRGYLTFAFLGTGYEVHWPMGTVQRAVDGSLPDVTTQLLLLHYLLTADGTPMADQWVAFRALRGGMGYEAAFRQRADLRLAKRFGSSREAFELAAQALGGERLTFGDASFGFRVMPSLWLAVVLHLEDDEFPAEASVLFDGAANHYLATEDLAVLGGLLTSRLIRSAST